MVWNAIGVILFAGVLFTVVYCWKDAKKEYKTKKSPMSRQEQ